MKTLKQYLDIFKKVPLEDPLTLAQREEVEKLNQEAGAVRIMINSRGWKVLEKYLNSNIKFLEDALKGINTDDEKTAVAKLRTLQAKIEANKYILDLVNRISNIDKLDQVEW